ncbi:MAG: hypothetical protein KA746_08750 [Pyrinomonadaceae bacterium]|nr:hypothetical protein [Pyrinomonadaceae bacterium]MBP6212461.1 hypothetical protein [Pyrinomonadaceae bacterium]
MKLRWRFGIIAGLFLAVFALYPQMKMVYLRGAEWQGHYAYNDVDEVAYASYLSALIDGRPRKNDPYTGRDDSAQDPQPESLFSIQFAAPYTIAIPARVFGIGAPWAMTLAGAFAAFATAFVIFWLIGMIMGDNWYAMAGSLFVLAGGALFAGEGAIGEILGTSYSYPYFPGFRRYIPAMAFPAFFGLIALVWKLLAGDDEGNRRSAGYTHILLIAAAACCFGYTVFSYFYVWTTAAAWLAGLVLTLLLLRPEGVWTDLKRLAILGAGCALFLVPYAYLLSRRSHTMDDVQLLVLTHAPDLFRVPELISYAVFAIIFSSVLLGKLELRSRPTVFAISLALVPIAVFNQQVITGRALQPIHYEVFIGNYVAGLALVVTVGLLIRGAAPAKLRAVFGVVAIVAAAWGFVECHYTVRILDEVNVLRDQQMPVARRLTELAGDAPDRFQQVVMHYGIAEGDDLPTIAPQATLWARHQHVFAGVTWDENKQRYYQYLYYQGTTPKQLADGMKKGDDFVSVIALFGWGRHTDRLNSAYKPLTFGEIDVEVLKYTEYIRTFDPARAGNRPLDYAIADAEYMPDFANIDRWYERDAGETHGKFILFRLKLRQ